VINDPLFCFEFFGSIFSSERNDRTLVIDRLID